MLLVVASVLHRSGGVVMASPDRPFATRLRGLLGGENPTLNLGLGLLAAGGPSAVPQSFGQRLASGVQFASDRERQAFANQAIRERLQALQQQRQQAGALRELIQDLGATEVGQLPNTEVTGMGGESIATIPGMQGRLPGNLTPLQARLLKTVAASDPAAAGNVLSGLLFPQQERAETSLVRNLEAAGIDPQSEQGRDLIVQSISGGDIRDQLTRIQATQAELQVERQREELEQARLEREQAQRTEQQEMAELQNSIETDVARGMEAATLIDSLEGTALQTGKASEMRQFGIGLLGLVSPENEALAAQSSRFNQIATSFGIRTLEHLRGTGTISNAKFNTLLNNTLSGSAEPGANRAALADIFETILSSSDTLNLSVPQRDRIEALIPRLRGTVDSGAQTFASEADAEAAFEAGEISVGDVVTINGRRVRVDP